MFRWDRNRGLDPQTDFEQIYRNLATYDFPWDFNQSLSFALFRTYAVPSVGALLDDSGGFDDTQKRYDDTVLLLEQPLVGGFADGDAKAAIRRINQMHRAYDISNDDMRYVLATFVVVPKRWIDDYGWRAMTYDEVVASVHYYRTLGRHMNIKDIPETYEEFAAFMDDYEAEHFSYDAGGRRVADTTLELLSSFYPRFARPGVRWFSRSLMDPPLIAALGYKEPSNLARSVGRAAMATRAGFVRMLPPRLRAKRFERSSRMKTYRKGAVVVEQLGTFPGGCPVSRANSDDGDRTAPAVAR
ncbi:MAG: oxygenase MpaB family protein [Gordonia sp. (in: high G+C Gram-positive bacteria)]|uniref:oxygenase MpaB family protein n=1 Tax=Gordonia sp. (in: high G+C Gram-positive bacteria) TaxID=84139 RepID=UPI003BB6C85C